MLTKQQVKERRERIVQWLLSEEMKGHRRDFRNGSGFSVNDRGRVNVDGNTVSLTEYLRREGIQDGEILGEYRVKINAATEQFPENFSFFLTAPVKEVPNFSGNGNRQFEIVDWLIDEDMKEAVRIFRDGRGFGVNERVRVSFGGEVLPITTWLQREGIVDGAVIGEYRVKVNPAEGQYPENISFFMMAPIVSVPKF